MNTRYLKLAVVIFLAAVLMATGAFAQKAEVSKKNKEIVTSYPSEHESNAVIDYRNAIPMPLPMLDTPPPGSSKDEALGQSGGVPGFESGRAGKAKSIPQAVESEDDFGIGPQAIESMLLDQVDAVEPQEFGTSNHVFTTARVDTNLYGNVATTYPFRASGKLYFNDGATTYMCSASMIKRGVLVTAAHCVASFGNQRFYTNFRFIPAMYSSTSRPYGEWAYRSATIMTSYFNGTDACYTPGVVCANDVAVLNMAPQNGVYPGTRTGWLGYGWNRWGFNSSSLALINQLGYPASHDSGYKMQRTDSEGYISSMAGNTVWGSRQTGGSSGGPEVLNLGTQASLYGTSYGSYANPNIVVGVTSWGYTSTYIKQQGASPFTSNNIVPLVNAACSYDPAACQ